jgi:hypothetical protein
MDKAPPARQTRSRPMTTEAGPSYFSHDGKAQCVLSKLAASRPVSVARERSVFASCEPPFLKVPFSRRICPAPLGALSSHETSCGAAPQLTSICAAKCVPHENVMSREEIIGRDDECYVHRRRRLLIRGDLRRSKSQMKCGLTSTAQVSLASCWLIWIVLTRG